MRGADKIFSVFYGLTGIFLILFFLIPYTASGASAPDLKHVLGPAQWLLSIFIVCGPALVLSLLFSGKEIRIPAAGPGLQKRLAAGLIFAALVLSHFLGYYCFLFKPHLIDTVVQTWQAGVFAAGKVYTEYDGPISFFFVQNLLFDEGRIYAQYPPGNSLFLVLNFLTGLPNLSGALLGFLTLVCTFRFCKRVYSQEAALLTLTLYLLSGFFLFNTQSFMNHVPGLAFAAFFADQYSLWSLKKDGRSLFLTGLALGLLFICRPLEGLLLAALFGLLSFREFIAPGSAAFKRICLFSLPFCGVAGIYFIFNYLTTGDPLLAGYIKLWGSGHELGFHESPWGESHTLLRGLESFWINLKLLNEYLLESPVPPLSVLGLYFLLKRRSLTMWDKRLGLFSMAVPFIYVFYWHRDSFLGPRYTYVALAFLMPLLGQALLVLYRSAPERFILSDARNFRSFSLRNFLFFTVLLSSLYILFAGIPYRAGIYNRTLASMKQSVRKDLPAHGSGQAIVFVKTSWGARIISSLRELGVSARLTEISYRRTDHCILWQRIREYRQSGAAAQQIEADLQGLMAERHNIMKVGLNGDRTLRLIKERPLDPVCLEEIGYDREGFTIYEPHLTENPAGFTPPLIVARDMREENRRLIERYPDITNYYLWKPGSMQKLSIRE